LYCQAEDYPQVARAALIEMHRQVGDLQINQMGIAQRGLLVRHLVMPGLLAETEAIAGFIAEKISPDTYVNIMEQYHPCYKASRFPEINWMLSRAEYNAALAAAKKKGLVRLDKKEMADFLRNLALH
jgi:putative pyruvate formate lyase activating enzyme